jgi:hypothetical protein
LTEREGEDLLEYSPPLFSLSFTHTLQERKQRKKRDTRELTHGKGHSVKKGKLGAFF